MTNPLLSLFASATIVSSGAIVLTVLVRKLFRRHFGPGLAYVLWLIVPISLLVLLLPAPRTGLKPALGVPISVSSLTAQMFPSPVAAAPVMQGPDWSMWLFCSWALGVLLFCWGLTYQQRRFIAGLGTMSEAGGAGFFTADSTSGPVVIGILRPRIVVPSDFATRYELRERELILAHERMHIRRGDLLANAICALARCIFWFNPLIHFAARLIRFDQELACDAAVMRNHPRARKLYASAMLSTQLADGALPLGCYWPATHPLKERLMVLNQPPTRGPRRIIGRMLVGTCVLLFGYGTWAQQSDTALTAAGSRVTYADSEIQIFSDSVQASERGVRYTGNVILKILGQEEGPSGGKISFTADRAQTSNSGHTANFMGHVGLDVETNGAHVQATSDKAWSFTTYPRTDQVAPSVRYDKKPPASRQGVLLLVGNVRLEMDGRVFNTDRAWLSGRGIFKMDDVEVVQSDSGDPAALRHIH